MPPPALEIPLRHSNDSPEKTTSGKRHFISHPSISHCSRGLSSLNMRAMSEYFLKLPGDSQPRSYSEYEVREFLGQGVIDSKTLTWKPGMDGWQPVGQVLPKKEPENLPYRKEDPDISPPPPTYRLRYSLFEFSRLAFPACFILLACSLWTLWIVCFHHIVDYAEVQTTLRQVFPSFSCSAFCASPPWPSSWSGFTGPAPTYSNSAFQGCGSLPWPALSSAACLSLAWCSMP